MHFLSNEAYKRGYVKLIDVMRKAGASNSYIYSSIDKMIADGLDINYLDTDRMTILMYNASKGQEYELGTTHQNRYNLKLRDKYGLSTCTRDS